MTKLIKVRKNEDGKIVNFMTDQDLVISFEQARSMAQNGEMGVMQDIYQDGSWTVDGVTHEGYHLDDLPSF